MAMRVRSLPPTSSSFMARLTLVTVESQSKLVAPERTDLATKPLYFSTRRCLDNRTPVTYFIYCMKKLEEPGRTRTRWRRSPGSSPRPWPPC